MEVHQYTMDLTLSKSTLVIGQVNNDETRYSFELYFGNLLYSRGLPEGGKEGQVLTKASGANFDVKWADMDHPLEIVDGLICVSYEEE